MTHNYEIQQQLDDSLTLLTKIFGSNLASVYLYGSSVVGGLQKYSDIDLFVITHRITKQEEKAALVDGLLPISGLYMKGSKLPLEMTIVAKHMVNPWHYPPHFDFQYGEWLRDSFEKGILQPWSTQKMPDLAVIVTQILLKSRTLYGLEPAQLLAPVPWQDFMKAMSGDLNRLSADLKDDTRNVLLTCARILSTVKTSAIRSKPAAADWVMHDLPEIYHPVIKRAKAICTGSENEYWDDIRTLLKPCAEYMIGKIHEQLALMNWEDTEKSISLAEA